MKKIIIIIVCIGIGLSILGVGLFYSDAIYYTYLEMVEGEADLSESWSAINQKINRVDDWQDFVDETEFQLGEIKTETDEYGEEYYTCDLGTYPSLDGSTVCVPMAMEFARQHLGVGDSTAEQFVNFSTTHYAYENLIFEGQYNTFCNYDNKDVDFWFDSVDLLLATEPSAEELQTAKDEGVTLIKKPICYDAFVFITHKDNPVDSLTVQQIKDIYSGKIKNWKEVGGKNEKIRAFQREENSGSQTAMENLVMNGEDMIDPIEVKVIVGMGGLVDAVAEYENDTASIGYTYRYYIDSLYKNDNIKTISVEGVAPTDENIRNQSYPFTTNYYGVVTSTSINGKGGKFLDWILSPEGQKCVEQAGYIAME